MSSIFTTSPVCGAAIILPSPTQMPTCPQVPPSLKNTRSPAPASAALIGQPTLTCSCEVRGSVMLTAALKTACTKPEQSTPVLNDVPPQTYFKPRCLLASTTTFWPLVD